MKKKLLSVLLIIVLVFNFIYTTNVYADLDDVSKDFSRYGGNSTIKGEAAQSIVENGTDSSGTSMTHQNAGPSFVGVLLQILASIIDAVPIALQSLMSLFTVNPSSSGDASFSGAISSLGATANHFTIERAVFNEVSMFNIDVFNFDESYTNGIGEHTETIYQSDLILTLKKSVAGWYYACRLLAMMINLCVLIYVGIKMAISTVASEEARYKKMLISWAESMLVLFFLHYIMYALIQVGHVILNIINVLRYNAIAENSSISFEDVIIDQIYLQFTISSGFSFFLYSIFFWFLTSLQLKFFITYMKRMFTVMFLTVISPFITVTYSIDKMGDGKAQAFEAWFKEFLINIAIQPIHAGIYLVFVYTAGKIAQKAPWVAMLFLLSLGRVENAVRNIFGIVDSVQNVDEARKEKKGGAGFGGMMKMFMKKD